MISGYFGLRLGPVSALLHRRALFVGATLSCVLLAVALVALGTGTYPIGFGQVWAVFAGRMDDIAELVVLDYRLPRLLAGIGCGAALGAAGAIFQSLLRNPLATPDIIGFTAGASCGAIAVIALTGTATWLLAGALTGGFAAAALVFALAWRDGLSPYRLILTGIGISFTLVAFSDYLLTRIDIMRAADATKWLAGTIDARNWNDIGLLLVGVLVLLPIALSQQFVLQRLQFDDDVAAGLGLRLSRARLMLACTGVALTALAVSVAGPLPFIALISAPIARRLLKTASPAVFSAALIGAVITVLADFAARNALGFIQLPTGVFTALIGAPYFLGLLIVQSRRGYL